MNTTELTISLEELREEEKERRNKELRARLMRPCSREELLKRLGELAKNRFDKQFR